MVFKETGCYLNTKTLDKPNRMQCFPYVSAENTNAQFAFGDGSVNYATQPHLPSTIYK